MRADPQLGARRRARTDLEADGAFFRDEVDDAALGDELGCLADRQRR
jgi:hypothetical protein